MRGMGRTFTRKGSPFVWISYYRRGKEIRESSKSTNKTHAEKLLKKRIGELSAEANGAMPFVGPKQDRILVEELFDSLEAKLEARGRKTKDFLYRVRPLREYFGFMRAIHTSEETIDRYISECRTDGQNPATINRRIKLLGQAFKLAVERKRLSYAPRVRLIPNADNPRQGFFERPEFEAMVKHLPVDLQDFTRFAYLTGWRKGEIASLLWDDTDLQGRIIRLRGEKSKNRAPRKVALEGELWEIIQRRALLREIITDNGVRSFPLVFHRDGAPIKSIRKAWASACKKARVVGKLFHDLRRTAVRNMVRAGVSEDIAMKISGHKTRSIFSRYNISTDDDFRDAAQKTEAYIHSLPQVQSDSRTNNGQSIENGGFHEE